VRDQGDKELEDSTEHEVSRSWAQANAATSEDGRNRRALKVAQAQNKLEKYCQQSSRTQRSRASQLPLAEVLAGQ